jgi:hypothetical protein
MYKLQLSIFIRRTTKPTQHSLNRYKTDKKREERVRDKL